MKLLRNIQNIIKNLSSRQKMFVFGGFLLLLVLLLVLISIGGADEKVVEQGSIDQPLSYGTGANIEINDETERSTEGEMYVHELILEDHSYLVQEFMVKIGKGLWNKEEFGTEYTVWKEKPVDNFYLVDYDSAHDRTFFRFNQPVALDQIKEGGTLTNEQMTEYLEKFINNYFGVDYKYMNIKVFKDGKNYRIEANRDIHGLPLELTGFHDYSDYIVITAEGDLLEGQVILMDYERRGAVVGVMDPDLVGTVINDYEYPKEFNQRMPEGFSYKDNLLGEVPSGAPHAPYLDEKFRIPSVESCHVRSMDLVYFFVRNDVQHLTPAYKLDCWGEISLQGEAYDVQNIIYTNAVDPDYVSTQ